MPPKTIQLNQLSPEQLRGLREQIENDIQSLSRAYEALKEGRGRFQESKYSLEGFKSAKAEEKVLVPLTASLYVPGAIKETETVLVDVGTGYFVRQSVPRAQAFFQRRADQMREQMDKVAESIAAKKQQSNLIVDAMRQQQLAAQQ
jgi:prefoldin alpha subunit